MKKIFMLTALLSVMSLVLAGCSAANEGVSSSGQASGSSSSQVSSSEPPAAEKPKETFPTDDEIMEKIKPYLANAAEQDLSAEGALSANLGITKDSISDAVLYMGMPNQNTTYFCMITLGEKSDVPAITEKLTSIMDGWVKTAEQGYVTGYDEYEIIKKRDKIFVVMHEDAAKYNELTAYFNGLSDK